ncbi:MAG TPA: hypothetical protein VGG33_26375 [Polyangia bacterium]
MSSKASSRNDEQVLVTGESADVPNVTVTTELPVHVPQDPPSNEVAAASETKAEPAESVDAVAPETASAVETSAAVTADDVDSSGKDAVVEAVSTQPGAELATEPSAETATIAVAASDAESTSAASPAEDTVQTSAGETLPTSNNQEPVAETPETPAADVVAGAGAEGVEQAASKTDDVVSPPVHAGSWEEEPTAKFDPVNAAEAASRATETSVAPPADDDLASLVSALADAQAQRPDEHHRVTSALLAAQPRSFVSSSNTPTASTEAVADHSAEPSSVLDATDLVIEADSEKETGVRQAPTPRSTMIGMGTFVTAPPIPADETFLRNVVLPHTARPTPHVGHTPVTRGSSGSVPVETTLDMGSEEHTVISTPPSPELLAAMSTSPSQDALAPFAALAPPKKPGSWRAKVTEKKVPLSYLQIGGLVVGALFLGGLGNGMLTRPAATPNADAPPVATDRATVTPLPPPPAAAAVAATGEAKAPPSNTAVIAPITRPAGPAASPPGEAGAATKATAKRARRVKRVATTKAAGKTWVDPFA